MPMSTETKASEHRRRAGARERGEVSIVGASAPRSGATPERAMGEERSEPGVIQSTQMTKVSEHRRRVGAEERSEPGVIQSTQMTQVSEPGVIRLPPLGEVPRIMQVPL